MAEERAVVIETPGAAEVLRVRPRDPGAPGAGQVRVRVAAAGVNFIDVYHRIGRYPRPLPFVAGMEGEGAVEAIGNGVRDLAVGDRVAWSSVPGSYASSVIAPVERVVRIPDGVASDVAAATMLQGMTAHYLVHGVRETKPGDVALVQAAAGGTGLLLVQMLKAAGARIIGTCSKAEKEALARGAGADDVIRYDQKPEFAAEVRRLTNGEGVHVVYDGVGKTTFEGSIASLRVRGLTGGFRHEPTSIRRVRLHCKQRQMRLGVLGS